MTNVAAPAVPKILNLLNRNLREGGPRVFAPHLRITHCDDSHAYSMMGGRSNPDTVYRRFKTSNRHARRTSGICCTVPLRPLKKVNILPHDSRFNSASITSS